MEEINVQTSLQSNSFIYDPHFVFVAVIAIILFSLAVRMFLPKMQHEYRYDPSMD